MQDVRVVESLVGGIGILAGMDIIIIAEEH